MAKKTEWTIERVNSEKPESVPNWTGPVPRFYKQCPSCSGLTKGYKSLKCKCCEKDFPATEPRVKSKSNGTAKPVFAGSGLDAVLSAKTFIDASGGLAKAIERIDALKATEEWTRSVGGTDAALELLQTLKSMGAK